ncbi:MAG: PorP/SprF family type IX secretion system membrane protein [Bacteroidota bacterium]|nr:PorP/SprF family type IX secretion system membrane protein [Bacteroidota bacterium]
MNKFYTILLYFVVLIPAEKMAAQDLTYSQFYEQPLLRNPALAGVFTGDMRISTAYRDQWESVTVPFRTTSLSAEYKLPASKNKDVFTLGTQLTVDAAGDIRLRRTQLLPAICFHKSLNTENDTYLSVAFIGGLVNSQFDQTLAIFGDQYQNGTVSSNTSSQPLKATGYSYFDVSTGVALSTNFADNGHIYIGAALSHFNRPAIKTTTGISTYNLPEKYTLNFGINYPLDERSRIIGYADYFAQNGGRQLLVGALYGMDVQNYYDTDPYTIYFGSFVRWNDSFIPVIKMDFQHYSVGLSYDVNISKLIVASNYRGGFEFTAVYKGFLTVTNEALQKVKCVNF